MLPSNPVLLLRPPAAVVASADTPLTIFGSNLVAWYKADAGVFNDAGSTPATDTQTVQQWNDQSGNNYHLKQSTSGKRPVYNAAGFNSLKTITFAAASSKAMATDAGVAMGTGNLGSAFAVGQMLTGTSSYGRLVSYKAPAQNDYNGAGSAALILRRAGNNQICTFQGNTDIAITSASLATNYRFGMIYDGTNVTAYLNNSAGTGNANSHSWADSGSIFVGDADVASYWDGPLSEIVITKSAASAGERLALDNYFKTKWGL